MKKASQILLIVFGLAFFGATAMNAVLVSKSRAALSGKALSDKLSAPPSRYQVMVVIPDTGDSFFEGLLEGIRDGAKDVDAAVQVFRYSGSSSAEAEDLYDLALRSKADGLVMYAPRDDRATGRAEEAALQGVVLVSVGTDPPVGGATSFIGCSSFLQGREGGRLICERLGGRARIGVILPSTASDDPREEPMYRGVAAAISGYRGASIVEAPRARPGALSGEEEAAAMLARTPSINAIFCPTARDTMGAAQVVIDMNRVGSVVVVGSDETPEMIRYIEKGVVAASVVRDTKRMGVEAMRMFARLKEGARSKEALEVGFAVRTAATGKKP
jgi:ribose transport system substrate-binding protein